jgi:hypothetical protein
MSTTPLNWWDRSTVLVDGTQRNNMISDLWNSGYQGSATGINNMTNDELLNQANQVNADNYQNKLRQRDRQDSLVDFRAQLSDLTASKQRQAEQSGRLATSNTRAQGLGQMMSNF